MNIGVVSDTHRNRDLLDDVTQWMVTRQKIVSLYHLGDDYEDVSGLDRYGIDIVQVPGIYNPCYFDGSLPKKIIENVMGLRIMLVHSMEKDVTEQDRAVTDIILFGHTHRPEIALRDGHLSLNPGHLKGRKDKNIDPTFALLSVQEKRVDAVIYDLNYKEIEIIGLVRAENGLFKS